MSIHFEQLDAGHGRFVAVATLQAEQRLNAQNLAMVQALDQQLQRWAADPAIACVLLRGSGSRAFCAGGDVVDLARACLANPGQIPQAAVQFFSHEYRLISRLHHFRKPLLCWGHGHVLGGGMGLLQGAGIRIVTASSRLAMPEIGIGLFPDVAASWFLSRLPGRLGLFFGLTGSAINASDALALGLADRYLGEHQQQALLDGLCRIDWREAPGPALIGLLQQLADAAGSAPASQWLERRARIDRLLDVASLPEAWQALCALRGDADPLLSRAADTLAEGCPLTAWLVWEQLQRGRLLSLGEVLRMEFDMSMHCCRNPEFAEGVRARLLDKDQQPRWHWPDVAGIDPALVAAHFQPALPGVHPLHDA